MELAWQKFTALGTDIVIAAYLKPQERDLLAKAQGYFQEFEQRFSRFVPSSELCALNAFGAGEYRVSDLLADLLERSLLYYNETNGVFDPSVIETLEGVGYDRNFAEIAGIGALDQEVLQRLENAKRIYQARPKFSELSIKGNILHLPANFKIDLGGIGKGFAVDRVAREIFDGIENFWISAGGDLLAQGNDGAKSGWQISVQNPLDPAKLSFSFNTLGGRIGIATSGIGKRKGGSGSQAWHHIIDPAIAGPADNDVLSVSLIAPTTEQADVYAKTVLILGPVNGMEFIEKRPDLEGAIYLKNKTAIFSSGLVKYL